MPDQSMFVFWLLSGGLVVVSAALGALAIACLRLRRDLAERDGALRRVGAERLARPAAGGAGAGLTKQEIATMLREEWAAFQAVYRADLARMQGETGTPDAAGLPHSSKSSADRLDQAIALAKAGQKGDFIARACGLAPADAEALVRFHGPERSAAASAQH